MKDLSDFHIHIVGLGLMGGSMAMALQGHVNCITASDTRPEVLASALDSGLIGGIDGGADADLVILAVPSDRIASVLAGIKLHPNQMIMDIGSTKTEICDAFDVLPDNVFSVGGHPMCGLAENGYENAIPNLYEGARFVLCPTNGSNEHIRKIAEQLVLACKAVPLWMGREQHDYLTALTSHVPHLLSFALMRLAMDIHGEDENLYKLAAGGFDGATRLSRTNEGMIRGMFTTNSVNIRQLTQRLRKHLDRLDALFDDADALSEELATIVDARRRYSSEYGERPIS